MRLRAQARARAYRKAGVTARFFIKGSGNED